MLHSYHIWYIKCFHDLHDSIFVLLIQNGLILENSEIQQFHAFLPFSFSTILLMCCVIKQNLVQDKFQPSTSIWGVCDLCSSCGCGLLFFEWSCIWNPYPMVSQGWTLHTPNMSYTPSMVYHVESCVHASSSFVIFVFEFSSFLLCIYWR